jgi:hypothetical protein
MNMQSLDRAAEHLLNDPFGILRADHRRIERFFERYQRITDEAEWPALMRDILRALKLHLKIEEKVLYPTYLRATNDTSGYRRSLVEHAAERKLIEDIEFADPGDEALESLMGTLIRRTLTHIRDEEKENGLFDAIRSGEVDLQQLRQSLSHYRDNHVGGELAWWGGR